jgi:hypothetical protein
MGIIGRGQKDNEIGTGRMEKERLKSVWKDENRKRDEKLTLQ